MTRKPEAPSPSGTLSVRDPYTDELIGELSYATDSQVKAALTRAEAAFGKWRHSQAHERAAVLKTARDRLESRREEFEEFIRKEAGKPARYAAVEVDRAMGVLDWAAAEALRFSGELLRLDTTSAGREGFGIHTRAPRGPVLGITPFNFPLNLLIHKVAPAIACGCPILIKPSPYTPLTAQKAVELFENADCPGLVQLVLTDHSTTAELTQAREIAMISFTGSATVGWQIRRQAPDKHMALELGGNAWAVVTESTPRDAWKRIAARVAGAAFGYAGQSCISVQNVAVEKSIWSEFSELLAQETQTTPFGDPSDTTVISGPSIHMEAAARIRVILEQAEKKLGSGAVVRSDRSIGPAPDTLISPVMLLTPPVTAKPDSYTWVNEEIFGPAMTARPYESTEHLIQQINSSRYGLQTGVFTQDLSLIQRLFRDLRVGGLIVNDVPTTRYDHQPYGGTKDSGFGREGVRYAMDDMTESRFLALSSVIP